MGKRSLLRSFRRKDDAASLAEYVLLLGVISIALLLVISQYSGSVSNLFARTTNTVAQIGDVAPVGSGTSGTGSTGGGTSGAETSGGGSSAGGQGNGVNGNGAGQGNGQGNNGNGNGNSGNNGQGNGNSTNNGSNSGAKKP